MAKRKRGRLRALRAAKLDHVADAQGRETWGDVDVVSDEERLARGELEYEALVTAAFNVIAQDPCHSAGVLGLDGELARLERIGDRLVRRTRANGRTRDCGRTATREQGSQHEHDQDASVHATSIESSNGMPLASCASNCLGMSGERAPGDACSCERESVDAIVQATRSDLACLTSAVPPDLDTSTSSSPSA